MRILLIEDDTMIGKAIREGLVQAGFAVDWVTDGHAAELSMSSVAYDLAIFDLGLPKKTIKDHVIKPDQTVAHQ